MSHKKWTSLRADIERIKKELSIDKNDFEAVNIEKWKIIYSTIEKHFLHHRPSLYMRSWLWNDLKVESFKINCRKDPYKKLKFLIVPQETVYFLVNETVNERTKYWVFEGKIDTIISVIDEAVGLDEYYLISKKYEWLLCTNHHDVLIGTGTMIPLMKKNKKILTT